MATVTKPHPDYVTSIGVLSDIMSNPLMWNMLGGGGGRGTGGGMCKSPTWLLRTIPGGFSVFNQLPCGNESYSHMCVLDGGPLIHPMLSAGGGMPVCGTPLGGAKMGMGRVALDHFSRPGMAGAGLGSLSLGGYDGRLSGESGGFGGLSMGVGMHWISPLDIGVGKFFDLMDDDWDDWDDLDAGEDPFVQIMRYVRQQKMVRGRWARVLGGDVADVGRTMYKSI
jgi:hypothetical protein